MKKRSFWWVLVFILLVLGGAARYGGCTTKSDRLDKVGGY